MLLVAFHVVACLYATEKVSHVSCVCTFSGEAGLRLSLLERLASSAPYAAAEQHPAAAAGLIVKLVRNYR
jgi:hypothetical protein